MEPLIEVFAPDPGALRDAGRLGLHPLAARVLANRASRAGVAPDWLLDLSLRSLDPPDGLPDIEVAARRVARAVTDREVVALVTDADSDGVNASAVLTRALVHHFGHPADRVRHYIGLKLTEGYGLSDSVCDRILESTSRPGLVITADIGSSDGPRIARLAAAGIDVVVTDHHGIPPQGGPDAALAFVNPQRPDSRYPDPLIAGVMVAWLLLWATRRQLIAGGQLRADSPSLRELFGWVATGTVADVVSLARSRNNRIVVRAGIDQIEAGTYPCWRALRPHLGDASKPLDASDLAFGIGPRLNAAGRLHDAMAGVRFLLAPDDASAADGVAVLNRTNEARREIEKRLTAEAMEVAREQALQGRCALVVFLTDGHAGVQGIVASRIMQAFGRPGVCLSARSDAPAVLAGSCRSIEGLPMLETLQALAHTDPELFLGYGGHAGAAGLTLRHERLADFEAAFEGEVSRRLRGQVLRPRILVDADVPPDGLDWELLDGLAAIGPYGREFSEPVFRSRFNVLEAREVGASGGHWRLALRHGGARVDGIWFGAGRDAPVRPGEDVQLVFTPEANWWRGQRRIQVRALACDPAPSYVAPSLLCAPA
ncbi:Single-stranded-DNA-specific exonuclease RecJ [Thioalkalivibrio nitratireducens DSM 14787]|uniref:Single-stranded-DNA-specific exonuclease RecJ n=1 Tax=Thioalkalivibrio nitratireducens (strain DSM 14787 / UNIQEM 213 / ALEN2) TaxID=1255043 RepID=L0DZI5_THIND|nr:DHHA1 domain-containing protein [Thioalkalivibrio nitratireducens]AGA34360.1 Single-stranded-DNA-specific exonuclease RecJ [Thioalkalivibrio nitratireducens DSM 14787]